MDRPSLFTARLELQPLQHDHADALYAIFSDSETLAYWHIPPHLSVAETRAMVDDYVSNAETPWWVMVKRDTGQVIGMTGYLLDALVPGMGYIIHRNHWRRGYGTEAVSTAIEYGFTALGLNRIELWIHEGNTASQGLARALGFKQRGRFYQRTPSHAAPYETLVFGLRVDEWQLGTKRAPQAMPSDPAILRVSPVIPTTDIEQTLAFYRDRLGFHIDFTAGDPPSYASVSRGEWTTERAQIHFTQRSEPATYVGSLYIQVGLQIDTLYDEFRARGVVVEMELTDQPWGMREFRVLDNNGVQLVFGAPR